MPKSYPPETRAKAQHLYVHEGMSIEAISDEMGVPIGTLNNWASSGHESTDGRSWVKQKHAISMETAGRVNALHRLGHDTMRRALKSGDVNDVYAALKVSDRLDGKAPDELEVRSARIALELKQIRAESERIDKAIEHAVEAAGKVANFEFSAEQIQGIKDIYGIREPAAPAGDGS